MRIKSEPLYHFLWSRFAVRVSLNITLIGTIVLCNTKRHQSTLHKTNNTHKTFNFYCITIYDGKFFFIIS